MTQKQIVLNLYIGGHYRGPRQIDRDSLAGRWLSGDRRGALRRAEAMKRDLERLGCSVSVDAATGEGE